jgi:GT2 family glycosyltransferase
VDIDVRVSVVIATRNRPAELTRTIDRIASLRPAPPVIVVDNASDGGAGWLRGYPGVSEVVELDRNRGGAARTVGAARAATQYVAFSDDDSWWAGDALRLAAGALDRHPRLGLVAARTLVGREQRPDPVNEAMAGSPLPEKSSVDGERLPGRPVLGCLACAAVVRREAFLAVGGFRELFLIGGEETLLCYDLAAAGWAVRYLPEVVAHHHPSTNRPPGRYRQAAQRRNQVLLGWMRRPLAVAAAGSWRLLREAARDPVARTALAGLLRRLPAALADRRRLPPWLERDVRLLEGAA